MSLPIFRDIVLRKETREHRRAGTDYLEREKKKKGLELLDRGMRDLEFMREARGRDGGTGIEEIEKKKNKRRVGRILRQPFRMESNRLRSGSGAETFWISRIG